METVTTRSRTFTGLTRVIVMFGPPAPMSGLRAGEYYQCILDPDQASPSGDFVRFGQYLGDELIGWQRVAALTVVEVLEEDAEAELRQKGGFERVDGSEITMRCLAIKE